MVLGKDSRYIFEVGATGCVDGLYARDERGGIEE
jgi:hypothetical protein